MAAEKDRGAAGSASADIGKYLEILAKDPTSRVFAPLAEAYRKAGLLDDAVETAREGLKIHPNYLGGRVALARAYFEKKNFAEARIEMQQVAKSAPDNLLAHKVLGQIAMELGDLPGAEKSLRMVLLLDPRDQEAAQLLAKISAPAPQPAPAPAARATPTAEPTPMIILPTSTPAPAPSVAQPPEVSSSAPAPPPLEEIEIQGLESPPPLPPPVEISFEEELGLAPPPSAAAPPTETAPAPELVFSSEPSPTPVPPSSTEDSVIEVFGRPLPSGPPLTHKGEEGAFREIELEPTAHTDEEPPAVEPEAESPFEVFTREPRGESRVAQQRHESHGEGGRHRELDLETTSYAPPEHAPEAAEPGVMSLDEEIPRIDLATEMQLMTAEDYLITEPLSPLAPVAVTAVTAAVPVPEMPEPVVELAPVEPWGEAPEEVSESPEGIPEGLPVGLPETLPTGPSLGPVLNLEEEIPQIDLAREMEVEAPGALEPEAEVIEEAPAPGRGMFDTETLARIYIDQKFYGRAADIYRRLVQERPGDVGLRRKLDEVLELERTEAAEVPAAIQMPDAEEPRAVLIPAASGPAPVVSPTEAAAAVGVTGGEHETIRKLQRFLDGIKGGRQR